MLSFLTRCFEFDHWANAEALKAIEVLAAPPEKAVKIFGHILFAKEVWLVRLKRGDTARFNDPWPPYALDECGPKLEDLRGRWADHLSSLDEGQLGQRIAYQNTQGRKAEHTLLNIVTQVAFHGQYHRGQLASLIASAGGKAPGTDYISYAFKTGEGRPLP